MRPKKDYKLLKFKTMEEKNYWLHRCKCGDRAWPFTHELLTKHNIISIGWSDFSDTDLHEKLIKDWESFEKVFEDADWGHPRNRTNLWRFLCEMKEGDVVVVPLDGGKFSIYKIADNTVYNNETFDQSLWVNWNGERASLDSEGYPAYSDGSQIDMGFYRKVIPVRLNISRNDYATQALHSRMKIMTTNANISDLAADVEQSIAQKEPINLKAAFVEASAKILCRQMQKLMNPDKIEELVRWYMVSLGASVNVPAKNSATTEEGDADVIATFEKLNNHTILIQVKAHQGFTDEWAVEQITFYAQTIEHSLEERTTQLWVISTCDDFTEETKKLAKEKGVLLVNGLDFAERLIDNGLYSLPL